MYIYTHIHACTTIYIYTYILHVRTIEIGMPQEYIHVVKNVFFCISNYMLLCRKNIFLGHKNIFLCDENISQCRNKYILQPEVLAFLLCMPEASW